jgi:mono/diheme cytochrome c family protein
MLRFLFRLVLFFAAFCIVAAAALWLVASRGYSARTAPGRVEEAIALRLRSLATPGDAAAKANPLPADADSLRGGMEHFADHCAMCHGNDGSGRSEFGPGLYPKPPDLRAARTQSLSDGELFYIIENGIRFTGMPAFGGEHSADDSWRLVHFIRHLPQQTPEELARMAKMNRVAPSAAPGPAAPHTHRH